MKEMIKLVSENFELIKKNFYENEKELIEDFCDEEDIEEFISILKFKVKKVTSSEELIDLINSYSIGIDLDNEEDLMMLNEEIQNYI
jgi:hypothetical protein